MNKSKLIYIHYICLLIIKVNVISKSPPKSICESKEYRIGQDFILVSNSDLLESYYHTENQKQLARKLAGTPVKIIRIHIEMGWCHVKVISENLKNEDGSEMELDVPLAALVPVIDFFLFSI